jgi:hypothetical protein
MKKLFAIVSSALLFAACSSTRGNLLSRIEYHDDEVFEREEYHYSDGNLALVSRVIYYNNAPDSSWTEYEIRRNGLTTDTIETINSIKRNIKSSDGSIRSYHLVGDEWKEDSYYNLDTLNKYVSDALICEYDNKGRIISRQLRIADDSQDYHPSYISDTFRYTRRGVTRIEYSNTYSDGCYHKEPIMMFKSRYRHGLRTRYVVYTVKDGKFRQQSINKTRYDFRAKVPLKSFAYSPSDYIIFRRPWQKTIWTYEK